MMTVDEALAIAEIALDYQDLNKIQEVVFRESWKGRSYVEIAKSTGYEPHYIRTAGAKLWKRLSTVFGEKVTKNNLHSILKRYLRQDKVNVQRNLTIQVNLNGANLSGANLTGSRLVANLIEMDSSQADSKQVIMPDNKTESGKESIHYEEANNNGNGISSNLKIASALDRAGVLFLPNCKIWLTTLEGRQKQEFDFLICYQGKWGILQVEGERWHYEAAGEKLQLLLKASGISIISHYSATRCNFEADKVVQEFLEILSQA